MTYFTVKGAAAPKDSALGSTGAELHTTKNFSLAGRFNGECARRADTCAVTGTVGQQ